MDVSEKMKYKLANGMKELLVHTPVDKITVKQIVDQCDVTRPTFYRHFKDKYDLINWYFDVLAQMSFKQMGISMTLREGLIKKFEFIKGEGQFFAAAFSSESQNCLMEYDYQCIYQFYCDIIHKQGVDKIPEKWVDKYKAGLIDFKALSVREDKAVDIVKNTIGITCHKVLDPTMLLERAEWDKIKKMPTKINGKNYCLLYTSPSPRDTR